MKFHQNSSQLSRCSPTWCNVCFVLFVTQYWFTFHHFPPKQATCNLYLCKFITPKPPRKRDVSVLSTPLFSPLFSSSCLLSGYNFSGLKVFTKSLLSADTALTLFLTAVRSSWQNMYHSYTLKKDVNGALTNPVLGSPIRPGIQIWFLYAANVSDFKWCLRSSQFIWEILFCSYYWTWMVITLAWR